MMNLKKQLACHSHNVINILLRILVLLVAMLMAACTSTPQDRTSQVHISSEQNTGRATTALLAKVDLQERAGQWERAAALLERALRIEPRNAHLWHRLARVRLQQGRHGMAMNLAQKSNALARDDTELQQKNARIIRQAQALLQQGT